MALDLRHPEGLVERESTRALIGRDQPEAVTPLVSTHLTSRLHECPPVTLAFLPNHERNHLTTTFVDAVQQQAHRTAFVLGDKPVETRGVVVHPADRDDGNAPGVGDQAPSPAPIGVGQRPDGHVSVRS